MGYLDSSNYYEFAHLLSFLGIEEQLTVVVEDKILKLFVISNGPDQGHLIDFWYMDSMW